MNKQTSNQQSPNFKTRKVPLKGFCHSHKQTGEYVCEKCRVFYCYFCVKQSKSAVMKCTICNKICTNLKKANFARANKKKAAFGLDPDELSKSFIVTEYSFFALALCFGGLYLSNTTVYLFTFVLLSGIFVHRIKLIFENKPFSKWFDFEIDNWQRYFKSAISTPLIFIICFAPAVIFAKLAISRMPVLERYLSSPDPRYNPIDYSQGVKEELSLLYNFNWDLLEKEERNKLQTGRMDSGKQEPSVANCRVVNKVVMVAPGLPEVRNTVQCDDESYKVTYVPPSKEELAVKDDRQFAELKSNFWWSKIFTGLFIGSLFWGIFYVPLAVGYSAVSANIAAGLNFLKWRRLAKNLTEDYGRVFFYWLCFLLLLAGTIYLELMMRDGNIFETNFKTQTSGYRVMQFFLAVFRFYLLYVLATMVGKMFYKNRLTVRI